MKKKNAKRSNEVYNEQERIEILERMRGVANSFYAGATQTRCHPFIEFCGLMSEYIKMCEAASHKGIDFTQANRHTGGALPMESYHANYLGEKIGCIYGPSLGDPKVFMAFIRALDLPFEIKIEEEEEKDAHSSKRLAG